MRLLAHGIGVVRDLPIPAVYFFVGAAVVLGVSFVLLFYLWRKPLLEAHAGGRKLPRGISAVVLSRAVRVVLGALSVGLLVLTIATALFGTTIELLNFAPTFVYVIFWLGIPLLSILFGNVWSVLSPWRAIADATVWVLELRGREARPVLEWTGRMGRYPAAAALFAFVALELAHPRPAYPRTLGIAVALYTYWALAGMAVYGRDAWTRFGEGFAVAFGLLARIAPFAVRDGSVVVRWPFTGLAGDDRIRGTLFFVAVMLGSTSFDGFSRSSTWQDLLVDLRAELAGSSQRTVDLATTFLNLVLCRSDPRDLSRGSRRGREPGRDRPVTRPRLRPPARPDRSGVHDCPLLHQLLDHGAVHHRADLRPVRARLGSLRDERLRTEPRDRLSGDDVVRPGHGPGRRACRRSRDRPRSCGGRVRGTAKRARGAASDARPHGPLHAWRNVAAHAWLVAHGGVAGAIVEASIALAVAGVLVWAWRRERRRSHEPGVQEHRGESDGRR